MKTILIIDDDPLILKMRSDRLIKEGYQILQAKEGQEGLSLALSKHPDAIILDIVMPVMDGISVLIKLRADPWGKDVPVMILSNQQDSKTISDAMNHQVFKYLIKDHDTEVMVDALHTILKDKQ